MAEQRLLIYIPSYNACPFLERTVNRIPWDRLPPTLSYSVLFVDNASKDGTPAAIERARLVLDQRGVHSDAVLHPVNRGYGGSVKTAFQYAFDNGFDLVVVLHSDGQYEPELLPKMISGLLADPRTALHYGSRLKGNPLAGGMPLYKFAANHVLSTLQNLCSGLRLSEYHSGYRLYRMEQIARIPWRLLNDGFVIENEIIFMIMLAGFRITEATIPTHYGEEKSHVPRIGTPVAILVNLLAFLMARMGLRDDPRYRVDNRERR